MIRNLKALGLALVAVFATSAVVVSAASGTTQGKLTSDGPVTLRGTETGAGTNYLFAFNRVTECPGSTFTGHKYNFTPHTTISSGETTVTITPHFNQKECRVITLGLPATVDTNGCDYVFHLGDTLGENVYGSRTDIVAQQKKPSK